MSSCRIVTLTIWVHVLCGYFATHPGVRGSEDGVWDGAMGDEDLQNGNQLEIADCYYATTSQHGLSCDREGYFINSFEGTVWWDPGELPTWEWERVPASRALCCRVAIPTSLPDQNSTTNATPVGVISVGCHTSSNEGGRVMQCESDGNSFVTGFLNSLSLPKTRNTFYPVDGVECCTPVILMSTGDAWSIERCGCTLQTDDISCGVPETGGFLWGYENRGETGKLRHAIPVQPAMCCNFCLGRKVHTLNNCKDLDMCNRNGVCELGTCQCMPGYSGSTCSDNNSASDGKQPWYQSFWLLGNLGCLLLIAGLGFLFLVAHYRNFGSRSRNENPETTNQLLTPEGSVGSVDTRTSSSVSSLATECGFHEIVDEEDSVPTNRYQDSESTTQTIDIAVALDLHTATRRINFSGEPGGSQDLPLMHGSVSSSQDHPDAECEEYGCSGDDRSGDENDEGKTSVPGKSDTITRPILSCSICFERPVQVALVPCGHSSLCRRCSRKLQQCPFCRKDIVRRQKLFMAG